MKISYSILVHNEDETFEKLLQRLIEYKQPQDEIVVLDDYSDNPKTKAILDYYSSTCDIKLDSRNLLKDFASQKNYLKGMCTGDYSFNLDADEMISHWFMKDIHQILEGLRGIARSESPRNIQDQMAAALPPKLQSKFELAA